VRQRNNRNRKKAGWGHFQNGKRTGIPKAEAEAASERIEKAENFIFQDTTRTTAMDGAVD
jgi:hypothetical protein